MPRLIVVKLIGQGKITSIVEHKHVRYEVNNSALSNCYSESVIGGFVNWCYINPRALVKVWQ